MKKYRLEFIDKENDVECRSENDGFSAMELIGLLEAKKLDIHAQMKGREKPNFVKRDYIEPEEGEK